MSENSAPVSAPTSAPATAAPSPTASPSPAPGIGAGALSAGASSSGATDAQGGAQKPLTAAEQRFLHKHHLPDGTALDVDITDFRHRLKVDGEEREVTLKELVSRYGPHVVSQKRFEAAAAEKRQAEALRQKLEQRTKALSNPETLVNYLIEQHGERAYDLLAHRLAERVKYEQLPDEERRRVDQMTHRERELRARETKAAEATRQLEAQQKAQQRARGEAQLKRWEAEWPMKFEALGLPNHPAVMRQATEYALETLSRAHRSQAPMTVQDAVSIAADHVRGLLEAAQQAGIKRTEERIARQPGREVPQSQGTIAPRVAAPMPRRSYREVLADMASKTGG